VTPAPPKTAAPAGEHHALASSGALAAIERERYASYSDLARNLHWLAAALVLLYAQLVPNAPRQVLYALAATMVSYTLALHSPLFRRLPIQVRIGLETAADLAWVTAVVTTTGGVASPLFFLYFTVLFASSPAASRASHYLKAGLATLLALGVPGGLSPDDPVAGLLAAASDLIWPLTSLWLVAYFTAESGTLGTRLQRSLFVEAHTDALTGLPNLRYFTSAADLRGQLAEPYAIVMVDADHLKKVNDSFGHAAGNALIRTVADALRSAARSGDDLCSRVGGDEFIVRLGGASAEGALAYCRRVRAYLVAHPLDTGRPQVWPISISTGIATFPQNGKTLSEVTAQADDALYKSKRNGRGQDAVWAGPTVSGVLPVVGPG
jgi:diguanylate cyclase (GGDEF)-like protein